MWNFFSHFTSTSPENNWTISCTCILNQTWLKGYIRVKWTFLVFFSGKVTSAVILLDVCSEVNAVDLVRDTPLHLALRANHAYDIAVQLTSTLLRYGASPTLLGRDDDMPIDVAKQTYQDYCLELLEDALGKKGCLCKIVLRLGSGKTDL